MLITKKINLLAFHLNSIIIHPVLTNKFTLTSRSLPVKRHASLALPSIRERNLTVSRRKASSANTSTRLDHWVFALQTLNLQLRKPSGTTLIIDDTLISHVVKGLRWLTAREVMEINCTAVDCQGQSQKKKNCFHVVKCLLQHILISEVITDTLSTDFTQT